jgi:pyruvate/2-oxoglutarate/acetoin dehydrogenase E1 component
MTDTTRPVEEEQASAISATEGRELSYMEAIREALREEMERSPDVFLIGEDIGVFQGAFGVTGELWKEFGEDRVRDSPISENSLVGVGVGSALMGMSPVVELMFGDFVLLAMDQIVNQAAKARLMSGGRVEVPLTIRTTTGATGAAAAHHSQSIEGWLLGMPGVKVVAPTTPADAKGLLKAAIRDRDPVIFLEHKRLYGTQGPVPDGDHLVPIGSASIRRRGTDVTLIGVSGLVVECLEAAEQAASAGIDVEVIDVRSIAPIDTATIFESVEKTSRVVVAQEAPNRGGVAAEIAALVAEYRIDVLDAPIQRVGAKPIPIPYSPVMESHVLPSTDDVAAALMRAMA